LEKLERRKSLHKKGIIEFRENHTSEARPKIKEAISILRQPLLL
jgi:hypothetical protein